MKKIAFSMTVPMALRAFMVDHIRALSEYYDVTVFTNLSNDDCSDLFDESVKLVHIPFARNPHPRWDFKCVRMLAGELRKGRFDSVHSMTPKAGLITMAAAWWVSIPIRIHMFTGQVWAARKGGFWRMVYKMVDRLMGFFATDLYADSPSQRLFLIDEKVISTCRVLGDGSVNGVDCNRFSPDIECSKSTRSKFNIPDDVTVFGFLGRLHIEKGLLDLVEAFAQLDSERTCLLLVGPDEGGIEDRVRDQYGMVSDRIIFAGSTPTPENYYPAFDVFCIPSYREGFGSAVIEAAACGVPALASRIYGLTDAVEDGVTGLMHDPRDISGILDGLRRYYEDRELALRLGENSRQRVIEKFQNHRLVEAMIAEYRNLL